MLRHAALCLVLLASACATHGPGARGTGPEARRPARSAGTALHPPGYQPIMRPVRNHVSDSIPGAFPALAPRVSEEEAAASRYHRAALPDLPDRTPAPPPALLADAAQEARD